MLIKYAVIFVSLININTLAEGFNQNRNILDLDGDQFTHFQSSEEYAAFQKFVNFKRTERSKLLDSIRQEITFFKQKNLVAKDEKVFQFVSKDFKKTNFQDVKTAYRLVLLFLFRSSNTHTTPSLSNTTDTRKQTKVFPLPNVQCS